MCTHGFFFIEKDIFQGQILVDPKFSFYNIFFPLRVQTNYSYVIEILNILPFKLGEVGNYLLLGDR
jgi:hypothetical protein